MKGIERSFWTVTTRESDGQDPPTYRDRILEHGAKHDFFREVLPLFAEEGFIVPGKYEWPFHYQLPVDLPGTFYDQGNIGRDRWKGEILYKFKATVDVKYRHDLKSTQRLVVNAKQDKLVAPSFADNGKSFLTTSGRLDCRAVIP